MDCKKSVSHKVLLPASPSSERMAITKGILFHDLRHPPLWDTYLELEETGGTMERGRGRGGGSWEVDIPVQPLQTSPLHSKRITLFSQRETTRNVCSVVLSLTHNSDRLSYIAQGDIHI